VIEGLETDSNSASHVWLLVASYWLLVVRCRVLAAVSSN